MGLLVWVELPSLTCHLGEVSECCVKGWQKAAPLLQGEELFILGDNVG
jgi:hypothetical protein